MRFSQHEVGNPSMWRSRSTVSGEPLVVLAAGEPGSTRLIDNLELEALTYAMAEHV